MSIGHPGYPGDDGVDAAREEQQAGPAVLHGARGPLRCALCRCPATVRAFGIAVCGHHEQHGEDGPPCPACVANLVRRGDGFDRRHASAAAPSAARTTLCGAPPTPRDLLANDARRMSPGALRSFNVCPACLDAATAAREAAARG